MVEIPPRAFEMGAPASEVGSDRVERPQHQVTILHAFAAGIFPITFDEWDAYVDDGESGAHRAGDEGWGRGRQPVINVSLNDATSYVACVSRKTGKKYRLLSEAEWEHACRAGTTTPFSSQNISTDQANYNGNFTYGDGQQGMYRAKPIEAGSFSPNTFGLFDLHGNVREWVEDCWHENYDDAPSDGSAWISGDCSRRVIRGGSWFMGPNQLRSAARTYETADSRKFNYSFRVGWNAHIVNASRLMSEPPVERRCGLWAFLVWTH